MTRRKDRAETRTPVARADLPQFEPVPRKPRHDGWTPERQRAFIGALADTGSVKRAARHVNMSPEGAYYLRRQPGSESFRRAWEAALNLGVQRLKDEMFDRALHGQLKPVFVGGKLKGFQRVRNDRLLMFALRMNAMDERGRRLSASYFDPAAERLSGSSLAPLPGERDAGGGENLPSSLGEAPGMGLRRLYTPLPLTRAEHDDMNAALVEHFAPVDMTLKEIEAMQAHLADLAARKRAEAPEDDTDPAFVELRSSDWKEAGELEGLVPEDDALEPFNPDEDDWRGLDLGDDVEGDRPG
ncbi:hypothetical protein [Tsuneonella sp. HG222]